MEKGGIAQHLCNAVPPSAACSPVRKGFIPVLLYLLWLSAPGCRVRAAVWRSYGTLLQHRDPCSQTQTLATGQASSHCQGDAGRDQQPERDVKPNQNSISTDQL